MYLIFCRIIIITTTLSIIFFAPSEPASADGVFYYWLEKTPLWLRDFDGVMITLLIAGGVFLFLNGGRKVEDKILRVRSFLLGIGLSILAVAISLNYIVALHASSKIDKNRQSGPIISCRFLCYTEKSR